MNEYRFSMDMVRRFGEKLRLEEKREATVQKYTYGICRFLGIGGPGDESSFNREELLGRKERLLSESSASTVNGILTAVNRFFEFLGFYELRLKYVKRQKRIFADNRRELRRGEYMRLVKTAERDGKDRTALILQTICSTGIRVSELKYITRRLVINGKGEVNCKGKVRMIFIPRKLRAKLLKYIKAGNLRGSVFVTRGGRPVDRSNIWREMKKLCGKAGVSWRKVFPHNLRHLFARTFYDREKDISKLADLLGHSGIETTRIYIMESFAEHINMLERMELVV